MQQEITALTVSQLNRQIRSWLEMDIGEIMVMGELSNLSKPASGHLYFTLKDPGAQLRCVYFRNHHREKGHQFKDGQQVIAKGRLSLYEARGDYQLIVHSLSEEGLGQLYQQFELLKIKLQSQGLFELARKKAIPRFPSIIGVITSATGAALRDVLTTLARRFPIAAVRVYASEVQGLGAAQQLIQAIKRAHQEQQAEVLILARGGGSIEDLWAFNDEQLALTIANSLIPIVSGVGHETDFTIADFVADLRAATPTAAAEAVTPNQLELIASIKTLEERMILAISRFMQHQQLILSHHLAKISSPEQLISKYWQTLDYFERQLRQNTKGLVRQKNHDLNLLTSRLQAKNPIVLLKQSQTKIQYFEQQLIQSLIAKLNRLKQNFSKQLATLHALSPLATLDRGYAIATHNKTILFNSKQVKTNDTIDLRLAEGRLVCKVIKEG